VNLILDKTRPIGHSDYRTVSPYWVLPVYVDLMLVCFNPIYFLDPLPDCIVSTECCMSIDFYRPHASCWVWTRTTEGSHKVTRRPSTSRPPGPYLSSQPARQPVQSKFDMWSLIWFRSKVWPMLSIFDSNKQKTPLEISVVFDRWGRCTVVKSAPFVKWSWNQEKYTLPWPWIQAVWAYDVYGDRPLLFWRNEKLF
jgi:hypothetical protein